MNRSEILADAKPILFNTDMVKAIDKDQKTETRRAIKFPINTYTDKIPEADKVSVFSNTLYSEKVSFAEEPFYCFNVKPPYKVGDYLYVRETWMISRARRFDAAVDIGFRAGGKDTILLFPNGGTDNPDRYGYDDFLRKWDKGHVWHPSIHMPKEAARIFLRVTDVRAERLQDITVEGCEREGIWDDYTACSPAYHDALIERAYPAVFSKLWDSNIKKSKMDRFGWAANPWVWVIRFEKILIS